MTARMVDGVIPWRPVLAVDVPGEPVGAARPRFVKATGRTYKEKKHEGWESVATLFVRRAWGSQGPIEGIAAVEVVAVVQRPQRLIPRALGGSLSAPGIARLVEAVGTCDGRLPCPAKPDGDNVLKLAQDAIVRAGVLVDDTQVVDARVETWWTALGEAPRVEIRVSTAGARWW